MFASMAITMSSLAQPVVLADYGHTSPVLSQQPQSSQSSKTIAVDTSPTELQRILKQNIAQQFVVSTPELTLGKVQNNPAKIEDMDFPMAIVGCDPYSYKWLDHYQESLQQKHITAMVVNCDNRQDFQKLQQAAQLTYLPVNGKAFIKRFGIEHYPVLITNEGISQ